MRRPSALFPVALAVIMVFTGCGAEESEAPGAVPFTRVDVPAGSVPVVLATVDDALLVGVRRDGEEVVPALLRRGADGAVADVAVNPAAPYGRQAEWVSIAADGERIVAVGGKRGGAHGNVRWSVWSGSDAGITEQPQTFSTFGGLGAGDLIGAVLTPAGPALVGTWQGARAGLDLAVWTPEGQTWVRRPSAGTPLENTRASLKFPLAATSLGQGVAVAGWELAKVEGGSRQRPTVWRSTFGNTGWSMDTLPDGGEAATAVAIRCWEAACAVAGRSDGVLAVWRLADGVWTRADGVPRIAVADDERLAAPVELDGRLTQVVARGDEVMIARASDDGWTTVRASGPTGQVTAVTVVGRTLYVLAGDELWYTDVGSLAG